MKRVFLFLFLSVFSYTLMAQSSGPSKKCSACGKSLVSCQYRGKHPKPAAPTPKPTPAKPAPSKPVKSTTGTINGHEWVDLGLSVKWATCNVGASSPGDYGGYYAWGETRPKSSYEWSNCFDCLDSTGDSWGIYKVGGQTRITPSCGHDTARENWGGDMAHANRLGIGGT